MTNTAKLAGAAHVIAEALEQLTPEQRTKAIEIAKILCPDTVIPAKVRKQRSDAGAPRKPNAAPLPAETI